MIPGTEKPRKGTLLISEPFMQEQHFKRSVVLLTAHNKEGSLGYILNRLLDLKLGDVLPQCAKSRLPLYLGGPVEKDNLFFIHTVGKYIEESVEISKGLYWGGNFDLLVDLINKGEIKSENIRFFIGYSGWSAGQLDNELKEKSWIVTKAKKEIVLNTKTDLLWGEVLKSMGGEYAQLANYPEDPSLN
jgi:putative transcriptional regulator